MNSNRAWLAVFALSLLTLLPTPASAEYINDGMVFKIYNLGNVGVPDLVGGDNDTYRFKVTLDTSGYTEIAEVPPDYFWAISIKVVEDYETSSLFSYTAPGTWTNVIGGLNNGGCAANANNGFACAQGTTSALLNGASPTTWEWIFDIDLDGAPGSGATLFDIPHLKANWFDPDGEKEGQISVDVPYEEGRDDETRSEEPSEEIPTDQDIPVPEPGSLLLLGSGLVAAASRFRRKAN